MPIDIPALSAAPAKPFRLTGLMVALGMLAFFVVVAGVNAVMMTVAIRTMPGVDVRSAYETSQNYNGEIARMHAQTERGWHAQARVMRRDDGALVTLVLSDHVGAPVAGLSVQARLQHPASRQNDRNAAMTETAPGRYAATMADVHRGGWTLSVEARRDGEIVFVSRSRLQLVE